jgi:hypothetical protein
MKFKTATLCLCFGVIASMLTLAADGLIAEPESMAGTVHFTGTVGGRPYHRATKLCDDAGLGAKGIVPPPHIFNVILTLEKSNREKLKSHIFRYISSMDKPVEVAKPKKEGRSSY